MRQIAIATAPLITGFCVLGRAEEVRFAREPTLGTVVTLVCRYCPLMPRTISGRDVVPDLFLNP